MHATTEALPSRALIGPVSWVGRFVLAIPAYMGGVTLMAAIAAGSVFRLGATIPPIFLASGRR